MNNAHSTKFYSGKVYRFQFEAVLLMFILAYCSGLFGKEQNTNQQNRNFYEIKAPGFYTHANKIITLE